MARGQGREAGVAVGRLLGAAGQECCGLCNATQFPHHHTDSINRVVSLLLRRSGA